MNQRIKDYLGLAAIIAVLLVAIAAWSYARTYARMVEPSSFRSFTVVGEGKAVTVPDVAQFSFGVITEGGNDLATLQEQNTTKVNKAIDYIKKQGVDAKDIKTENYSVEPRYQSTSCGYRSSVMEVCPPPSIVGYTVRQTVVVKARDFSKVGAMLSGVVQNGANNVSQLFFTVDDPTEVQNEARAEAIAKAKAKAESLAEAGGFKVGRLLSIDEGGYPGPYYAKDMAYGMGGGMMDVRSEAAAPAVEPGSDETVINVILRYEIK